MSGEFIILQVTQIKSQRTNERSKQVYFEMCDMAGRKVGGAISIPVPAEMLMPEIKTVVLSTLEAGEIVTRLEKHSP